MWKTYAVGLTAAVAMAVGWALVQTAWRRVFARVGRDPDALAVRSTCGGSCGCTGVSCEEKEQRPAAARS